jgi:hypothetical protein
MLGADKKLTALVTKLVSTGETDLDRTELKALTSLIKHADSPDAHVVTVVTHIFQLLEKKKHAQIRLLCLKLLCEFVQRSVKARELTNVQCHRLVELFVEGPAVAPNPAKFAALSRDLFLDVIQDWDRLYSMSFPIFGVVHRRLRPELHDREEKRKARERADADAFRVMQTQAEDVFSRYEVAVQQLKQVLLILVPDTDHVFDEDLRNAGISTKDDEDEDDDQGDQGEDGDIFKEFERDGRGTDVLDDFRDIQGRSILSNSTEIHLGSSFAASSSSSKPAFQSSSSSSSSTAVAADGWDFSAFENGSTRLKNDQDPVRKQALELYLELMYGIRPQLKRFLKKGARIATQEFIQQCLDAMSVLDQLRLRCTLVDIDEMALQAAGMKFKLENEDDLQDHDQMETVYTGRVTAVLQTLGTSDDVSAAAKDDEDDPFADEKEDHEKSKSVSNDVAKSLASSSSSSSKATGPTSAAAAAHEEFAKTIHYSSFQLGRATSDIGHRFYGDRNVDDDLLAKQTTISYSAQYFEPIAASAPISEVDLRAMHQRRRPVPTSGSSSVDQPAPKRRKKSSTNTSSRLVDLKAADDTVLNRLRKKVQSSIRKNGFASVDELNNRVLDQMYRDRFANSNTVDRRE